jgi:hypothetical protein
MLFVFQTFFTEKSGEKFKSFSGLPTAGPNLTGLLPISQPEPNGLPEPQPPVQCTFRVYQPPTTRHDIFIPELPDYASTYPEQDIPQLSWPTESQMGNLNTFAANFVDDMSSFSSGNFPNQESGTRKQLDQMPLHLIPSQLQRRLDQRKLLPYSQSGCMYIPVFPRYHGQGHIYQICYLHPIIIL